MGKNKNKNKKASAQSEQTAKIVELPDSSDEETKTKRTPAKSGLKEPHKKPTEVAYVPEHVAKEEKVGKKEKTPPKENPDEEKKKQPVEEAVKKPNEAAKESNVKEEKAGAQPQGDCVVCDKLAKSFCSVCKHVFYCTREHQKQHWNTHKEDCKSLAKLPYRIERNDQFGRFLVAQTDLSPGQLIFNELPMIIGPRQLTKPVCLGCHKELKSPKDVYTCTRCHWPLCSRKCEDSQFHDPECRIIRAGGQKAKIENYGQINMMYACITVLRALALREGSQNIWKEYTKFESHLQERMETPVYTKVNKEKVVFFIHHYLKLLSHYSDLEILEACGKLDTNCFELKIDAKNLRALYRLGSVMSHDCRPNTRHTFDGDYGLNMYATVKIPKGAIISVSYTQSIWNTMNRRQHLKMSKCFWCLCQRCRDPTEFGTFLSALNCAKCGGKMVPANPLDQNSPHRCQVCSHTLDAKQIRDGHERLTNELKSLDRSNPSNLEDFLKKYATVIPDHHQLSREIQYSLMLLYKNNSELPTQELLKKSLICKQLLELADKIEPGMTKLRGQVLFELQSASVILAQRALDEGRLEKWKAKEIFEENIHRLTEAVSILQIEPDCREELQAEMAKMSKLLEDDE